jgi:predicted ATPase/DNA-binding CsgD family transcriptional regulator
MGARSAKAGLSSLPGEPTSFVGRREELREIKRLLATTRLVTLVGSGGSGKTRLAVRAAAEMARAFADGVWFVPLAALQDPLLVPQAVFNGLGVHDLSAGLSLATLTDYLDGKRLLLVLDNCEHLLDASAVLAGSLLRACPELHLLVTSRQALGVAGEVRTVVPPMSLPQEDDPPTVAHLLKSDAVWLFAERAAAVVPGFVADAANGDAVLRLCRRLDGIPLALELAAVRLGSLSLDQLHEGLATELSILGSGNRGAEPRQRTLESTIGWSYGLLGEPERLLWARLSVFAGGCDHDAAVAVCADARLPAGAVVDLLGALVEKSILNRQLSHGNAPRYWLLETLRRYGRHRLREYGEETAIQKRHFEWICGLGRAAGAWDGRQPEMFQRMHRERDNLWAALRYCLRHPEEVAPAAELAQNLMPYWVCRGPYTDVRRVLASLVELAPDDSAQRARLLLVQAVIAATQNDYDDSAELSRESLRIGRLVKDVEVVAWSLIHVGMPRWVHDDLSEAVDLFQSAISLSRLMNLSATELVALITLCGILAASGDLDRAVEIGDRALVVSRSCGELWQRGYLLNFLSQANWSRGERQLAEAQAREGAACKRAIDDRTGLSILLETLASMAAERDAHQRAATLLGAAERVRTASNLPLTALFRTQHERSVALARRGMGPTTFAAAFRSGLTMTIDEGVAFAVDGGAPRSRPEPAVKPGPRTPLTRRELEIATLIADDLTNREIARRLSLSERTVQTHVTNMLNKLGLRSRAQVARWLAGVDDAGPANAGERAGVSRAGH